MSSISILLLTAGKGTRMKSSLAKVLHRVNGKPMIARVCQSVRPLKPTSLAVVIGHQGGQVRDFLKNEQPGSKFFVQKVLNGSGGAVRQAMSWLKSQRGDVIVACGDA